MQPFCMKIAEVKDRFLEVVKDAGLPAPDEVWQEGASVAFCWTEHQLVVYVDPDRDDIAPID